MRICGSCLSDIGSSRGTNQDAIFFECVEQNGQSFAVGAVCDGIGGLEQGELASAMMIESVRRWFCTVAAWVDIGETDGSLLFSHLKDAAEEWNEELYEYCREQNVRTGTTMSVIMVICDKYYIVHVGDSRIYCYHNSLEVLTTDTCISVIKNGRVKSYLDNYMGKQRELRFQALEGHITAGDMILFCSDGFYHHMSEQDIKKTYRFLQKKKEWDTILRALIETAIERGEKDNISLGIFIAESKKHRIIG